MQQFEPLCDQFHIEDGYSGHVPARPSKAIYEAKLDRVGAENKNDRDCFGRCLGGKRRRGSTTCDNHGHVAAYQFARQLGQPIVLILGPAILDSHIPPLDIAGFDHEKRRTERARRFQRPGAEITDHWHRRLLRARGERPCNRRAAERGYQFPAFDCDWRVPLLCEGCLAKGTIARRERAVFTFRKDAKSVPSAWPLCLLRGLAEN
jgi:hypothetical protein